MIMIAQLLAFICISVAIRSDIMAQDCVFYEVISTKEQKNASGDSPADIFSGLRTVPKGSHARGDYSQLQYTIRMNRSGKYKLGEPIFICGYVKNLSNSIVTVMATSPLHLFSTDRVFVLDAGGNDVPMTCAAEQEGLSVRCGKIPSRFNSGTTSFERVRHLHPQDEIELKPGPIVLNRYFDMTQPGVYHLTFHRISFHENQKYDEPLSSNTLTIEVLDEPVTPEDLKDPGEFRFPAPEKTGDDENAKPDTPCE